MRLDPTAAVKGMYGRHVLRAAEKERRYIPMYKDPVCCGRPRVWEPQADGGGVFFCGASLRR